MVTEVLKMPPEAHGHGRIDTKVFPFKLFRYKSKSIRYTCKVDSIQTEVVSKQK